MRIKIRGLIIVGIAVILMVPVMAAAADRFTDVPDANVFHDDINWLADAGVTLGCNPPTNDQFCPSDTVTRQQMSAFMRRFAAFLGAEDGVVSEADDAGTLDGAAPTAYQTVVSGQAFDWNGKGTIELAAGVATTIVETTIAAPADGYLMITNTAALTSKAPGWITGTWVQLDDTVCAGTSTVPVDHVPGTLVYTSAEDTDDENAHAGSAVVAVSAGDHTVTYCGTSDVDDLTDVWSANVMALWTAAGSSSVLAPPTPVGSPADANG